MSHVTNYILTLTADFYDGGLVSELNRLIYEASEWQGKEAFLSVKQGCGGSKAFEIGVYLFAGKSFMPNEMLEVLEQLKFPRWRGTMQLFCNDEGDEGTADEVRELFRSAPVRKLIEMTDEQRHEALSVIFSGLCTKCWGVLWPGQQPNDEFCDGCSPDCPGADA